MYYPFNSNFTFLSGLSFYTANHGSVMLVVTKLQISYEKEKERKRNNNKQTNKNKSKI